jgi:SAM-dependent methyltransferase
MSAGAPTSGRAAARWADGLAGWAIPEAIRRAAPSDPYRFDVARFARVADRAADGPDQGASPSVRRAADVLPDGGSVLDVGCGVGAASLPLVPPADQVIGVDPQADMLAAFAERVRARGGRPTTVVGRWPDVAPRVPAADVVVCHHVVYNVPDLAAFAVALTRHARRRVVVELSRHHPLAWTTPYWRALHDLDRPAGPSSDDAARVLRDAGFALEVVHWETPNRLREEDDDTRLAFVRARLCVGRDRDPELRAAIAATPPPAVRPVTTLWWDAG